MRGGVRSATEIPAGTLAAHQVASRSVRRRRGLGGLGPARPRFPRRSGRARGSLRLLQEALRERRRHALRALALLRVLGSRRILRVLQGPARPRAQADRRALLRRAAATALVEPARTRADVEDGAARGL